MSKLGFDPVNPGKSDRKCNETPKWIVPYRGKLMICSPFNSTPYCQYFENKSSKQFKHGFQSSECRTSHNESGNHTNQYPTFLIVLGCDFSKMINDTETSIGYGILNNVIGNPDNKTYECRDHCCNNIFSIYGVRTIIIEVESPIPHRSSSARKMSNSNSNAVCSLPHTGQITDSPLVAEGLHRPAFGHHQLLVGFEAPGAGRMGRAGEVVLPAYAAHAVRFHVVYVGVPAP